MEVPDERGIQDIPPGNPRALLGTVPLPVDEVLMPPPAAPNLQEATDSPRRMVVNNPGWRWGRGRRGQRAGGDGLDLGHMEGGMYTEGWGKPETNGTGVDDSLDLKRSNEPGGRF